MDLYKFVSFVFILLVVSEAKQQRFIADFSASQKLHHSTLLMLVSFLLGSIYTKMR